MNITAAHTRHQGKEFVVLLVEDWVIDDPTRRSEMITFGESEFGVRVVLLGGNSLQAFGPPDLGHMLRMIDVNDLPWAEYPLLAA